VGVIGLQEGDVLSEYRAHLALIAAGDRVKPRRALLIEVDGTGFPRLYEFGPDFTKREAMSLLLGITQSLNAEASN
jgi:hypothetical protein